MTPTQIEGLHVCLCFTLSMVTLVPILWWVLPNRQPAGRRLTYRGVRYSA